VAKQIELAKEGDQAAVKFVMGFIAQQSPPQQQVKEIKIIEKVRVVGGKKPRRTTEVRNEPRVVEAAEPRPVEPPKPVAIDSPAASQLRRLVGLHLAANGKARVAELVAALEIPADQLRAVLNCGWFAECAGQWMLTPDGNQNCK
jgi:hypothetical protein